MAVCEAYAQRSVCDHLREGEIRGLNIKVALDNLQIGRYAAQEFVGLAICNVPEAENLANLSRR